jgi:phosphatidate phosphatase LPIN
MKVGDAGEAFFVFETEQEVPEEFATSPLAGPSSPDKVEEEIDFLDLAQEGGDSHVAIQPNDQGKYNNSLRLKTNKRNALLEAGC